MSQLLEKRGIARTATTADSSTPVVPGTTDAASAQEPGTETSETPSSTSAGPGLGTLRGVTIRLSAIPGAKARDIVKIAVLPLSAVSPTVTLDLTIRAEGGLSGIPRETLNLVVLEGLRQLGIADVDVEESDASDNL
jgi:hypothetical protein